MSKEKLNITGKETFKKVASKEGVKKDFHEYVNTKEGEKKSYEEIYEWLEDAVKGTGAKEDSLHKKLKEELQLKWDDARDLINYLREKFLTEEDDSKNIDSQKQKEKQIAAQMLAYLEAEQAKKEAA